MRSAVRATKAGVHLDLSSVLLVATSATGAARRLATD
jgi:hypothetical protein